MVRRLLYLLGRQLDCSELGSRRTPSISTFPKFAIASFKGASFKVQFSGIDVAHFFILRKNQVYLMRLNKITKECILTPQIPCYRSSNHSYTFAIALTTFETSLMLRERGNSMLIVSEVVHLWSERLHPPA